MKNPIATADRPSRHGALLGEALAKIADAGRKANPGVPDPCLTCAFRLGSMPNQMAGTGKIALDCVTGADPDDFACHHGMDENWPTRLCAGYAAARLAPFDVAREALADLVKKLNAAAGDDEIRARFDAWLAEVDPDGDLDVYQLGRRYAANPPVQP